jgi:hypothetical protein
MSKNSRATSGLSRRNFVLAAAGAAAAVAAEVRVLAANVTTFTQIRTGNPDVRARLQRA